jgi:hypothetical protein
VLVAGPDDPDHVLRVRRFLSWALPAARVFDDATRDAFHACVGPKAVFQRTPMLDPAACSCPDVGAPWMKRCVVQRASPFMPADVQNIYCLP